MCGTTTGNACAKSEQFVSMHLQCSGYIYHLDTCCGRLHVCHNYVTHSAPPVPRIPRRGHLQSTPMIVIMTVYVNTQAACPTQCSFTSWTRRKNNHLRKISLRLQILSLPTQVRQLYFACLCLSSLTCIVHIPTKSEYLF